MDMFDVVKAGLGGLSGSSGQSAALNAVVALLGQGGGLQGLVQSFERQGLGHLAASWVGTGANLPVSADQIHEVLGSSQVSQFAAQAGIAPESAAATLAQFLPTVIDKLTPQGQIQGGQSLPGLDVLAQLLK